MIRINFKKLHPDAKIPFYATPGSVAFDIQSIEDINIMPGGLEMVHTGLAIELPINTELQVRQRSGLSLTFPNYIAIGVGTIDSDYRGEIIVPVKNNNNLGKYFRIKKGDRIAQAIAASVLKPELVLVEELSKTERGTGGFGHTGVE